MALTLREPQENSFLFGTSDVSRRVLISNLGKDEKGLPPEVASAHVLKSFRRLSRWSLICQYEPIFSDGHLSHTNSVPHLRSIKTQGKAHLGGSNLISVSARSIYTPFTRSWKKQSFLVASHRTSPIKNVQRQSTPPRIGGRWPSTGAGRAGPFGVLDRREEGA